MEKDRAELLKIISVTLPPGIPCDDTFQIRTLCDALERYAEGVRAEAIGWTHADACLTLDRGGDPRVSNVPEILSRAMADLGDPPVVAEPIEIVSSVVEK